MTRYSTVGLMEGRNNMSINRRRFVKALGGTLAGRMLLGPTAGALLAQEANAQNAAQPKFISWVTPIGHHTDWTPVTGSSGNGTGNMTMGALSQSLAPYKDQLMYFQNMWSVLKHYSNSGAHKAGYPAATTGDVDFSLNPSPSSHVSIDQYLIKGWGAQGQSLEMNVGGANDYRAYTSWSGRAQPVLPSKNPRGLFDITFRGLSNGNAEQATATRARGQSLLDVWTQEIKQLESTLSADHRSALDAHLTHLNQLEKSLNEVAESVCSKPENMQASEFYRDVASNYPTIGRHFIDIIVAAFSCGIRRTAALSWSHAGGNIRHNRWISGVENRGHHSISHDGNRTRSIEQCGLIGQWYTEQFSYLLESLNSIDTGSGSLLDSTLVYWGTELGNVRSHSGANMRLLVAGNYNNYFKTGRYYNLNQVPVNNLMAELCTGLGVQTQKFGNTNFCTGNLPNIRA